MYGSCSDSHDLGARHGLLLGKECCAYQVLALCCVCVSPCKYDNQRVESDQQQRAVHMCSGMSTADTTWGPAGVAGVGLVA